MLKAFQLGIKTLLAGVLIPVWARHKGNTET